MSTTPHALLRILNRLGIQLTPDGHNLQYDSTRGLMTAELLQVLRTYKAALLATLKQ